MSDTSSELSSIASSAFARLSSTPPLTIAEQSTDAISAAATASTVEELPFILFDGRKYVREEYISKKRPRRSWIYKYGFARRNRLRDDILEASTLLRHWYNMGIFD
jgi:hypothetical protein